LTGDLSGLANKNEK